MTEGKKRKKRGEKEETEQFTTRLTPRAKDRLKAVAQLGEETAYAILEGAFWHYWNTALSKEKRDAAEAFSVAMAKLRRGDG